MRELDFSRQHDDPLAAVLSPLALDRQRVVYSAAFRRLQHKTQVFVAPDSDHVRSRLTHTLEVAHQARCLAGAAGLNPELAEVTALAHDLGHPPFGHAGEQALDECLRSHGGFEHNRHSLRIVEHLEHPYPEFRGLNLTHVVRECLAKHDTRYDQPGSHPLQDGQPPPPEGRAADLADSLAYGLHDLLDGLHAGLLTPAMMRAVELWRWAYRGPEDSVAEWRGWLQPTVDRIQRRVLEDIAGRGERSSTSPADRWPGLSDELDGQLDELNHFLLTHVYRSEQMERADEQGRQILRTVFEAYVHDPTHLPPRFLKRIGEQGVWRVVTDYVAGMTDRFCIEEQTRLADL